MGNSTHFKTNGTKQSKYFADQLCFVDINNRGVFWIGYSNSTVLERGLVGFADRPILVQWHPTKPTVSDRIGLIHSTIIFK